MGSYAAAATHGARRSVASSACYPEAPAATISSPTPASRSLWHFCSAFGRRGGGSHRDERQAPSPVGGSRKAVNGRPAWGWMLWSGRGGRPTGWRRALSGNQPCPGLLPLSLFVLPWGLQVSPPTPLLWFPIVHRLMGNFMASCDISGSFGIQDHKFPRYYLDFASNNLLIYGCTRSGDGDLSHYSDRSVDLRGRTWFLVSTTLCRCLLQ